MMVNHSVLPDKTYRQKATYITTVVLWVAFPSSVPYSDPMPHWLNRVSRWVPEFCM